VPERSYAEPPLTEAVFELFADADAAQGFEAAQFFSQYGEYVSEPQPWQNAVVGLQVRDGQLLSTSLKREGSAERRWNKERNRAVLVGAEVLAYNVLPPYGRFDDHRPVLTRLLESYLALARPTSLQWVGHRYLNRITAAGKPSELLAIYPRFPDALEAKHPPFSIQVEAASFDGGVVVANLGLAECTDDEATYLLDLYARSSVPLNGWGVPEMISWHDRAHVAVSDAFEMAITNAARKQFKEQP